MILLTYLSLLLFFNSKLNSFRLKNSAKYYKLKSSTIFNSNEEIADSIANEIVSAVQDQEKLQVESILATLCSQKEYHEHFWQKKPLLLRSKLENIINSYTMLDVKSAIDDEFLEAGRGSFQDGLTGWKMASVSKPRGKSFEEAKLIYDDVAIAMKEKNGSFIHTTYNLIKYLA
jgi:hypothetical protein